MGFSDRRLVSVFSLHSSHLTHWDQAESCQVQILVIDAVIIQNAMAEAAIACRIRNANDGEPAAHTRHYT